jgi:hypothetical protein
LRHWKEKGIMAKVQGVFLIHTRDIGYEMCVVIFKHRIWWTESPKDDFEA